MSAKINTSKSLKITITMSIASKILKYTVMLPIKKEPVEVQICA